MKNQSINKKQREENENYFIILLSNLFGIVVAQIIFSIIIIIFVGILVGGIYLYKYIDDDIDKQPTRNILLGLSFFLMGISSLVLLILLSPLIISYATMFFTFFGLNKLVDTF